jgi:hypothetical protein
MGHSILPISGTCPVRNGNNIHSASKTAEAVNF